MKPELGFGAERPVADPQVRRRLRIAHLDPAFAGPDLWARSAISTGAARVASSIEGAYGSAPGCFVQ